MMEKREKIIVILPALNEEGKIGCVVSRIRQQGEIKIDEILVINDGSRDNTGLEAKNNGAVVISHQSRGGVGSAIRTGIDYALKNRYDIAVIMGGDNQDSPEEIKRLLCPIRYEYFDFVQGSRYMAGGKRVNMPLFRRFAVSLYSFLLKLILRFPISDGTNGFRAFRLDIFNKNKIDIWQSWLDHYELEPYLFYKVIKGNFKVTEVPVTKSYPCGKVGYTKMIPIVSWWSILRPLIFLGLGIKK